MWLWFLIYFFIFSNMQLSAIITQSNITWFCIWYDNDWGHDDVIKWKHFRRYWPFVRGIHRSPVNFPHKGQWRGALMYSLICVWIKGWVNNGEACDLRCYRTHYDVTVMQNMHHKRHPISHLHGRAKGCLLWGFGLNWPCYNGTPLYCSDRYLSSVMPYQGVNARKT